MPRRKGDAGEGQENQAAPTEAAAEVRSRPPREARSARDLGGSSPPLSSGSAKSVSGPGRIPIGAVLNHIYQVKRLISRGGMGEVYEGINVNTDERVAIKAVLAHLTQDAKVQALFRAEANVLTRLSHDTLVQYRVMAREPALDVLYLVMDFVDGESLEDLIGRIHMDASALKALTRRLAEGLAVAHANNVFHRDISPDNIMLPGGQLEAAKIIDFGIAKDVQSTNTTIVGAGFAGKLNFVAPEQLGDFGRRIGPWTDIYSLGLVMLSVAAGKTVDMGATLVGAVDKRRAGPSLDALPPSLHPVFAHMLAADPDHRFQSMNDLIAALDAIPDDPEAAGPKSRTKAAEVVPPGPRSTPPRSQPPAPSPKATPSPAIASGGPSRTTLLVGAAVGIAVILGLILLVSGRHAPAPSGLAAQSSAVVGQAVQATTPPKAPAPHSRKPARATAPSPKPTKSKVARHEPATRHEAHHASPAPSAPAGPAPLDIGGPERH